MGEMSIFASKFNRNSVSLKEYDEVLLYLKKHKEIVQAPENEGKIRKILTVIEPISDVIEGNLSNSTAIDERSVLKTLRQRHEKQWYSYKDEILRLNEKLKSKKFTLSKNDFEILNDIADALDVECGHLFKRLSEI